MQLDIGIEGWPSGDWEALSARAATAAAQVAPELANPCLIASLLFTSDVEIRELNREWRGKDMATNVLSFPMLERADLLALPREGPPEMLGDITLAFETCAREATDKGVLLQDHVSHLIIHGLLHLAGYDHELGEAEAEEMEALEVKALALLGLGDPYSGDQSRPEN